MYYHLRWLFVLIIPFTYTITLSLLCNQYDSTEEFDYKFIVEPKISGNNMSIQQIVFNFIFYNAEYSWSKVLKKDTSMRQKYMRVKNAVDCFKAVFPKDIVVNRPSNREGNEAISTWRHKIHDAIMEALTQFERDFRELKLLKDRDKLSVTFFRKKKKEIKEYLCRNEGIEV
jgi:hypothetical protein